MKKLLITTIYRDVVVNIMKSLQLVERNAIPQGGDSLLVLDYPDDSLSQEADMWLGIAQVQTH